MNRKFLANLAFLIFVNLLVKPFWIFGIDRTVQNTVGSEEYGFYFAVFNFSYLFHIILDFGITNYNSRSVARDDSHITTYLPSILVVKAALALGYLGLTFLAAFGIDYSSEQLSMLAILGLNQILLSGILYLRSNISGMHLFKLDSLLSVLDRVLMILICGFLLWGSVLPGSFEIKHFIYAQTASLGFTFIIALGTVLTRPQVTFNIDFSKVGQLLKETYPYAILGILMTIYYRIDGVMIERMLPETGSYEAGAYAASYRLLDAFNIIGVLFAVILLPLFARMLKNNESVKELVEVGFKTIFFGASGVAILCFFYSEPIIELLYDAGTDYWASIMEVLMFGYIGATTVYIYGTLLTANASLKALNWIALSGALLNVVLNFFLIQTYQAYGAALATLITQSLVAIAHIIAGHRIINIPYNFSLLLRLVVFGFIVAGATYGTTLLSMDWRINFVIASIIMLLLAFVLRLLDLKELLQLVRKPAS